METLKGKARLAGLSYLLIIFCGSFSHKIVRASIMIKGNASETALNILDNQLLFKLSILSDFLMIMSYIALGLLLFTKFKNTNKLISTVLLALNVVGVAIMAINMLNQYAALVVLNNGEYLSAFTTAQREALSLFFMTLHQYGYLIATLSYGVWLLPMGYLLIKSKVFPKIIGYFLMTGAITYVIYMMTMFLDIQVPSEITLPADIGEFSFCFYLLFKGIKVKQVRE